MIGEIRSAAFQRLQVGGLRRLKDITVSMQPLMVLIGANGIGKTSLLDVFSLLAAAARGNLGEAINAAGGLAGLLTDGAAEELRLSVSMSLRGRAPLQYDLRIAPSGPAYQIVSETLVQQLDLGAPKPFKHIDSQRGNIRYYEWSNKKLIRPTWEHNPSETSLFQVPKMHREPEEFRRRLASATYYHALDVGPRSPVRLPQAIHLAEVPGKDGEDLVLCLYQMREVDPDRYAVLLDSVRAAFPDFRGLDFPIAAAGTMSMLWRDDHLKRPLGMHQLSEGILRFLWLAALLLSPGLTTITLLDEPEVSLHPELLSLLAGLLREASARTQLVVATHSDLLIRFLDASEVVVLDKDASGMAQLTWAADLPNVQNWLADYTLDQVWNMGRLGGRAAS